MSKLDKLLADIHEKLAETFLKKVESDEVTAAELSVIRQFLKDNNIDSASARTPGSTLQKLGEVVPFPSKDEPISKAEG